MTGPLRRAALYIGLVDDKAQPAARYAHGELTWFQLEMIAGYAVIATLLWVSFAASGRRTVLELAAFWSLLVLWMAWVAVRRARTPRSDPPDQDA